MNPQPVRTPRGVLIATIIMGIVILLPSGVGFVNKLREFANLAQGDAEGAFALTPMANYLFASLGFFCLLMWATMQGMFHDIEQPKHTMLDREDELDIDEPMTVPAWAGGHPSEHDKAKRQ